MSVVYSFTEAEIVSKLNILKEQIISTLYQEGLIDVNNANKFLENYVLVVRGPGWWGQTIDKILSPPETNQVKIEIVKIVNKQLQSNKDDNNKSNFKLIKLDDYLLTKEPCEKIAEKEQHEEIKTEEIIAKIETETNHE